MRPQLLCSITLVPFAFLLTPKYVTLNDLDWLYRTKICFRAGLAAYHRATSESNCVKINKDRHILCAAQISGMDNWTLVSGDRFVRIFGRVL